MKYGDSDHERGYIVTSSLDGDGVELTGDVGDISDAERAALIALGKSCHDTAHIPDDAVLGFFRTDDAHSVTLRPPRRVATKPYLAPEGQRNR